MTLIAGLLLCLIIAWFVFQRFGGFLTIILIVVGIAIFVAWLIIHSFIAFSHGQKVATVQATQVANEPHTMMVNLTTLDAYGDSHTETYKVAGDRWLLQAEFVQYQPWVLVAMPSAYHLERIEGQYDAQQADSTPISLGGWTFFNGIEDNVQVFGLVIKSAYSSAVIEPANDHTYTIYADPSGGLFAN